MLLKLPSKIYSNCENQRQPEQVDLYLPGTSDEGFPYPNLFCGMDNKHINQILFGAIHPVIERLQKKNYVHGISSEAYFCGNNCPESEQLILVFHFVVNVGKLKLNLIRGTGNSQQLFWQIRGEVGQSFPGFAQPPVNQRHKSLTLLKKQHYQD